MKTLIVFLKKSYLQQACPQEIPLQINIPGLGEFPSMLHNVLANHPILYVHQFLPQHLTNIRLHLHYHYWLKNQGINCFMYFTSNKYFFIDPQQCKCLLLPQINRCCVCLTTKPWLLLLMLSNTNPLLSVSHCNIVIWFQWNEDNWFSFLEHFHLWSM